MALNIPLPGLPGNALLQGLNTGSSLFARYMQPIIQREQLAEQGKYHQGTLAHQQKQLEQQALHQAQQMELQRQQLAQAHAFDAIKKQIMQQQLKKLEHSNDPMYEFQQFQNMANMFGGGQGTSQPTQQPKSSFGEGQGLFNPESMPRPQEKPQSGMNLDMFKQNPMLRGFFKHKFGFDPLAQNPESPEEKRAQDLESKKQLEEYKTEQKKIMEEEKAKLKNEATKQKVIESAKNDLPHLKQTLDALEKMKDIATKNPDLFGHSGIFGFGAQGAAERFANTTENPNAGAWQTYGLGPIVAAESKMSSKGNQLALKQALANKPNFAETQPVALSKLNASIKQIKQSIEENKKLTGTKEKNSEKEEIKELNGKKYKKMNGEWYELH
jgi:hypothetical protein